LYEFCGCFGPSHLNSVGPLAIISDTNMKLPGMLPNLLIT